ncbi:hypothetical protein BDZ89DRAFT_1137134 [Hymenopellis radicata]|nr:hypothetical protein BDZ89DRAFT_1137134 [Hymenopellis radicata]
MQDLVNACLRDGTRMGRLEMINFQIQPVKWRGRRVKLNWSPSDPLDPIVVRPILWELAEINFRWELLSLDSVLYTLQTERALMDSEEEGQRDDWEEYDATTRLDREAAILSSALAYCGGSIVPSQCEELDIGFASQNPSQRQAAICGLFLIMKGWSLSRKSMPNDTRTAGNRMALVVKENRSLSGQELDNTEYLIVLWYVECFATVFNRAPIVPRRRHM